MASANNETLAKSVTSAPAGQGEQGAPTHPRNLEFKALLLLFLMLVLVGTSVFYIVYARGVFESTQQVYLIAEDSEGVIVGMDMTFSGFPIGRVRRIELADDGKARIIVDVPLKDSKWLRASSVFTMERGLVGETKLRAFTGLLTDAPLPDGAVRNVLRGDASAQIPRLVASVHDLLENLQNMTRADSALNLSLDNVKSASDGMKGRYGALGVALGGDANARKLMTTIDLTNTLLARADERIFGSSGALQEVQATVAQLRQLLTQARGSLHKVDAVLVEAQAVGANARVATADLAQLRTQVEASLRQIDSLVNEVNRKWPFARDTEIKLP